MDFALTADQELLQDSARRLFVGECPPSLVRAHIDDRSAALPLWAQLAGWTELGDGPLADLCLFVEEAGAVCAPGPFFATAVLYSTVRGLLGDVDGATGTVAVAGSAGDWVPNGERVKTFVLDADLVDTVAFVVEGPGGLAVGAAPSTSVEMREVKTLDPSRRVYEATVPEGIDFVPIGAEVFEDLMERAWVALAAETLGTARWLFDKTLEYAKQRHQFGRPIGSFQALQHKLANMALARDRAWAAVYYAAMTIDEHQAGRRAATHVAKAQACEAARLCAKEGVQIHGGIGFTWEHDLHLWMRRAFASEHLLGTPDWHHDRLADVILALAV
jgi:alkylation response protein AidB-like acyl-CoA dehydrogenase